MYSEKIAFFPGSFDPFTNGHHHIVERALKLFDKIIIGIGTNSTKNGLLSYEARELLIKRVFINVPNVDIVSFTGLTAEYCKQRGINFLIRGIRNGVDFDYEKALEALNKDFHPNLETLFLNTEPRLAHITSSFVREVYLAGGNSSIYIPDNQHIKDYI